MLQERRIAELSLCFHEVTVSTSTERVVARVLGLNLTLAALVIYLLLRHDWCTPGLAAGGIAEEDLRPSPGYAGQQRCSRPPPWSAPSCR